MGVITYESEAASPVPAARLFKALVLESEHLPQIIPDVVKSVQIVEGDGGPGTIKKITVVEEGKGTHVVKQKIEELDKVNLKTSFTLLEGSSDKVEKICYKLAFVPSDDGGSICKSTTQITTKVDCDVSEEHFKTDAMAKANVKSVGEYLLAHPHVCT